MSELEQCYRALEQIGSSIVLKSDNGRPRTAKIEKAMRITRAAQTPGGQVLAKRIIQLERQQAARQAYAPIMKVMGQDQTCGFAEGGETEEELLEKLRELKAEHARISMIVRRMRGLED